MKAVIPLNQSTRKRQDRLGKAPASRSVFRSAREMKTTLISLGIIWLSATNAISASVVASRAQDWGMVQSVGGLRVDDPIKHEDETTFLPVICNVSGLETITVKPQTLNSALVVRKIAAKVKANAIRIQIITGVADNRHNARTSGVNLGKVPPGRYAVEYVNPDGSAVEIKGAQVE